MRTFTNWSYARGGVALLLLVSALSVAAPPKKPKDTTPTPPPVVAPPIVCGPGEVANPPGITPPCYTPLPPEWTPRLAFYISTMPNAGGSAPDPHYIPPPKPGEVFITVPILWDIYQSHAKANLNFPYLPIRGGLRAGDTWVAHLSQGLCFLLVQHQTPLPDRTVLNSIATNGDSSAGGGSSSTDGNKGGCAIPQPGGTAAAPAGDVTIELH